MSNRKLTKEAKSFILMQMGNNDRLDLETVMDFVRPHYLFDPEASREQGIRAVSRNLIKQIRDDRGLSEFYHFTDEDGKSAYLNISKTVDPVAYNKAEQQVVKQVNTLNEVAKKFKLNRQRLEGQISMFDAEEG